jgi:hypothetical protein
VRAVAYASQSCWPPASRSPDSSASTKKRHLGLDSPGDRHYTRACAGIRGTGTTVHSRGIGKLLYCRERRVGIVEALALHRTYTPEIITDPSGERPARRVAVPRLQTIIVAASAQWQDTYELTSVWSALRARRRRQSWFST